ncbi:MAG: hypothetical protein LUE14_07870 [Clostridiales bacterium]|nr:hypothetical protein [Clostridiales bacterium]
MIGKAYLAVFPYFDRRAHRMSFKKRPVLVIGKADERDLVVLPISRVTRSENIDPHYDFQVTVQDYPSMALTATSYIRTHKQTVVNEGELTKCITDFSGDYPDAYLTILSLVEEFQKYLIYHAFE